MSANAGVLRWIATLSDDDLADAIVLSDGGDGVCFPHVLRQCLECLAQGKPLPPQGYVSKYEKRVELERILARVH